MMPDATAERVAARWQSELPIVGSPVRNAAERSRTQLGERADELANQLGNPNREASANRARDALEDWQATVSRDTASQVYDDVDAAITQPGRTTPLLNTRQTIRQLLDEDAGAGTIVNQGAIGVVAQAAARNGGSTYDGLKRLRTVVGDMMSGKLAPEPGTSQPALKRLYGALTDDLEQAIRRAGGQPAVDAWQYANAVQRAIGSVRRDVSRLIGVRGDATPSQVINRITRMAGSTDAGSVERLQMARVAIDDADAGAWDDLGAAIIGHMGHDPAGDAFSPRRFAAN